MGKLKEKFTKERIKEFCRKVGGKIKTDKIYDTYACVIDLEDLGLAYNLMQETKKLLQDIPEIQVSYGQVFKGDTEFEIVTDPVVAGMESIYAQPEKIEIGIQNVKGTRVFYISAKKSRELGGADITLKFMDSGIAGNTAGTASLSIEKGHTRVKTVVDLDIIKAFQNEVVKARKRG